VDVVFKKKRNKRKIVHVYLFELFIEFCGCRTINVLKLLDKVSQGPLAVFKYIVVTPSLGHY